MWLLFALGSAFFAGLSTILAKCGIRETDSTVATAIRTFVVLIFSFIIVLIVGSGSAITEISNKTWVFLILSGLSTGASWLCYFKALQEGDVNKVVPIDKSSTILSMVLAFIFLREPFTFSSIIAVLLIGSGTLLMVEKTGNYDSTSKDRYWLIYAFLSALFAALTSILGKIGIEEVESNLGTAIRTVVVLIMSWMMVFISGKKDKIHGIPKNDFLFIILSGFATGASWLCYYRALQDGPASVVVPIDKLSLLVTVAFSYFVLKERLSLKSLAGLILVTTGTLLITLSSFT